MNPAVFVLFSLIATSAMLSIILAIAWASFGRPRHALTWSISYGLGTVEWLVSLTGNVSALESGPWRGIVVLLATFVLTLLAIGYRQRIDVRHTALPLVAIACVSLAVSATAALLAPGTPWDRAPILLFMSLMLVVSGTTLVGRERPANTAETAAFTAICVFAVFNVAVAALTFQQGMANAADMMTLRTILLFGTPIAYTSVGLFSVFLLAADLAEQMRRLAIVDPLTAILNRRGLEQAAGVAIANASRAGLPLAVAIGDLDRFKLLNDTHGHAAGDQALQQFARHVEATIRKGDLFGRMGGEEFALVLSNTTAAAAMEVTERVRAGIERIGATDGGYAMTASFGISGLAATDLGLHDVLARADAALYRAKMAGRNRVMMADDPVEWPGAPGGSGERRADPRRPAPPRSARRRAPPSAPGAA